MDANFAQTPIEMETQREIKDRLFLFGEINLHTQILERTCPKELSIYLSQFLINFVDTQYYRGGGGGKELRPETRYGVMQSFLQYSQRTSETTQLAIFSALYTKEGHPPAFEVEKLTENGEFVSCKISSDQYRDEGEKPILVKDGDVHIAKDQQETDMILENVQHLHEFSEKQCNDSIVFAIRMM